MKSIAVLGFCLALAGNAYAQVPYFAAGDDGEGIFGWKGDTGSGSGSGSNGGDSSSGYGSEYGSSDNGYDVFAGFNIDEAMRYRTAHGVIAALCFVILFPAGAILMRIIPGRHAWLVHAIFQSIAYILYVAAAALGIRLTQMVKIPREGSSLLEMSSTNAHPIIGIVLLAVLFLQPPLGFIHHSKFKRLGRRTAYSHAHLWLGRSALTLGIINGGLGLKLARASKGVVIAYSIVAAIIWLLWLAAAVLGEVRRRHESRGRSVETRAYVGTLPPINTVPSDMAPPTPAFGRSSRRHNYHHHRNSYDPSPPYTPSPYHNNPPGYTGSGNRVVEMRPVKNSMRRSESVSSMSSSQTQGEVEHRI
ncbi:hypothetical protein F4804DRAFT_318570 [Jackrogersella minutella]|nr:hypothetical protein F4804DRAFT_318570 [Jackrogersella minutella]